MQISKAYAEADWSAGNVTLPLALNHRGGDLAVEIIVTGTINFDLQSTNSNLQAGETAAWLVDSAGATGVTASKWLTFNAVPRFFRIAVNSFSSGATVKLMITQSDV